MSLRTRGSNGRRSGRRGAPSPLLTARSSAGWPLGTSVRSRLWTVSLPTLTPRRSTLCERPTSGSIVSDRERQRPQAPVAVAFILLAGAGGTWAARIPAIKAGLQLSPGILGLALLGPAIGSVLAMPATGALLA